MHLMSMHARYKVKLGGRGSTRAHAFPRGHPGDRRVAGFAVEIVFQVQLQPSALSLHPFRVGSAANLSGAITPFIAFEKNNPENC